MPDNENEQPLESDDDALNQGSESGGDGGDLGANSADSGQNAQPESSSVDDLSHIDKSLSKIDKLSAAMAKFARASADRKFGEKVKEIEMKANEVDADSQADSQQDLTDDEPDQEASAPEPEPVTGPDQDSWPEDKPEDNQEPAPTIADPLDDVDTQSDNSENASIEAVHNSESEPETADDIANAFFGGDEEISSQDVHNKVLEIEAGAESVAQDESESNAESELQSASETDPVESAVEIAGIDEKAATDKESTTDEPAEVAEQIVDDISESAEIAQELQDEVVAEFEDSKHGKAHVEDETINGDSSSSDTTEPGELQLDASAKGIDEEVIDERPSALVDQVLDLGEASRPVETEDQQQSTEVDIDLIEELISLPDAQSPVQSDANEVEEVESFADEVDTDAPAAKTVDEINEELSPPETTATELPDPQPPNPELAAQEANEKESFSADQLSGHISNMLDTLGESAAQEQPKPTTAKASSATDYAGSTDSPPSSNADLENLTSELNDILQGKSTREIEESAVKQSPAAVSQETQSDVDQQTPVKAVESAASAEINPKQELQLPNDEITSLLEAVDQSTDGLVDQAQAGDSDLVDISSQLDDILKPGDKSPITEDDEVVETQDAPQHTDSDVDSSATEKTSASAAQGQADDNDDELDSENKPVVTEDDISELVSQVEDSIASESLEDSVDAADEQQAEVAATEESLTDGNISELDDELAGQVDALMQSGASQEHDETESEESKDEQTISEDENDTEVDATADTQGEESFAGTDDAESSGVAENSETDEAEEQFASDASSEDSKRKESGDEENSVMKTDDDESDGDKNEDRKKKKYPKRGEKVDGDEEGDEKNSEPSGRLEKLVLLQATINCIEPYAVPVLRRANYPLRYVPVKMRPIVDWIALSTLFWVPIVWMIALLSS